LTVAQNGGSPILGYDLWRDDGLNGNYFRLYTADNVLSLIYYDTLVLKNRVYRYKYRARNINGWGDFSNPGYIFAADLPFQPDQPRLISVTSTTMTIELFPPKDTGGSDIISFELWRDQGTPNSAFVLVPSFTGASMTHTLTVSTDSLVTGNIY
jgi:hypothetical protein